MTFDAELTDRLCRYAAIDSQSDELSATAPSTAIQLNLARLLEQELREIGAADVRLTDYGTVIATIPGTVPGPTVGFLAHMDTAPQFNATGVKPRVIRGYNGGDITFPDAPLVLSPKEFPYLAEKVGQDIITASGTTLLGADDKAGVAILMTMARAAGRPISAAPHPAAGLYPRRRDRSRRQPPAANRSGGRLRLYARRRRGGRG